MRPNTKQTTIYNETIVDDLLKIIDSKIRYLTYELDVFLKTQFQVTTEITDELIHEQLKQLDWTSSTTNAYLILEKIESTSRKKTLLFLLKKRTVATSLNRVLALLDEDQFLSYSPQQLQFLLAKKQKTATVNLSMVNYAKQVA